MKFNIKLPFTELPVTSALLMLDCVGMGCFIFEIACKILIYVVSNCNLSSLLIAAYHRKSNVFGVKFDRGY